MFMMWNRSNAPTPQSDGHSQRTKLDAKTNCKTSEKKWRKRKEAKTPKIGRFTKHCAGKHQQR